MQAIAAAIGWSFVVCAVLGAVVPGMNFHVAFVGDDAALAWHRRWAAELEAQIKKRAAAQKGSND